MTDKKETPQNIFNHSDLKITAEDLNNLSAIFDTLDLDSLDETIGLKAIFAALMLPEDEFAIMSEILLNELEKGLNSMDDKLLMLQSMNAAGVKLEDLTLVLEESFETITKEMKQGFSAQKIDFMKRFMALIINSLNSAEGIASRIIPVAIELVHKEAQRPIYAKAGDAGLDLYAVEDIEIGPGETKLIPTGIKIALPLGYEVQVRPRSGLSLKTPLRVANSPGTIDANYRGEIGVIIQNTEPSIKDIEYEYEIVDDKPIGIKVKSIAHGGSYTITKGMRFAQIVLNEVPSIAFYEVDSVGEIGEDRASGFGETGLF